MRIQKDPTREAECLKILLDEKDEVFKYKFRKKALISHDQIEVWVLVFLPLKAAHVFHYVILQTT